MTPEENGRMFKMTAQSPLVEFSDQNGIRVEFQDVVLSELPQMEHFNVRLQPDDRGLLKILQGALGFGFPLESNTFVIHDNVLCAWLGIDEWLIIAPLDQADRVEGKLTDLLAGRFATLVKLGSAQTIFRVAGASAAEFLSRGIAIDLDPSSFQVGHCVQTVLAHSHVTVLNHTRNELMFDFVVRRSYADHLWRWLLDVGREEIFRS